MSGGGALLGVGSVFRAPLGELHGRAGQARNGGGLEQGTTLLLGPDTGNQRGKSCSPLPEAGEVLVPSPQTDLGVAWECTGRHMELRVPGFKAAAQRPRPPGIACRGLKAESRRAILL